MNANEKIKTVNYKIKQNKAKYNLDWQKVKISALSSENVGKYELLTGNDVLLEKAATIKRFEYSPLGRELKKQTDIVKDQYQRLEKVCDMDKTE